MKHNCRFQIGQVVSNQDIMEEFKVANSGGMRRSRKTNALILINDHTKGLYDDKWYGDILHYTGMGQTGDQSLEFMQNKTLYESNQTDISIHLFEVFIPTEYIYHGEVELIDDPYQEWQKDVEGNLRQVWMFPLRLKQAKQEIPHELIAKSAERKRQQAKRLSMESLAERAREGETDQPSQREVISTAYIRDEFVAQYAKERADGICQLCEQEAPFQTKDGEPYLECHHVEWLSKGGSDTIDNTVALCPNCHRKMHALNLSEDVRKLKEIAKENV